MKHNYFLQNEPIFISRTRPVGAGHARLSVNLAVCFNKYLL